MPEFPDGAVNGRLPEAKPWATKIAKLCEDAWACARERIHDSTKLKDGKCGLSTFHRFLAQVICDGDNLPAGPSGTDHLGLFTPRNILLNKREASKKQATKSKLTNEAKKKKASLGNQ